MPGRKCHLILICTGSVTLQPISQQGSETSVASAHCAAVGWQWPICFGQFMVHIFAASDPPPERSGGVAHNSDFLPSSMSTLCPGMKLTLACRLGAEISPNRRDKNLIPRDLVVREQPWGHDVRGVLLSACCRRGKTCGA